MSNERKFTWVTRGDRFRTEVVCWGFTDDDVDEVNPVFKIFPTFNVYACVYPAHPLFKAIVEGVYGDVEEVESIDDFRIMHRNEDGSVCCAQVGNDYNHLWDFERRTSMGIDSYKPISLKDAVDAMIPPFMEAKAVFNRLEAAAKGKEDEAG